MSAFEEHLLDIHDEIFIDNEDRALYTRMFDDVRDWLLREMRRVSPVFNKLCKGPRLFGSYTNRVRIIKPSEFDVFILLDFPFEIDVELDDKRPGFVNLNLYETLDDLEADPHYQDVYETFYELTNNKYYLKRTSLQWWIHDIIEQVITRYELCGYTIEYDKRSVAHTIRAKKNWYSNRKISIDFVPAFEIGKCDWMHIRRYPPFEDEYFYSFCAIPKSCPIKGQTSSNLTFQLVNPVAERDMLWDKQNLKVVYRLLKSLRNAYGLRRIKSYHLTAVFLWEAKRRKPEFWEYPVDFIFIYMLETLKEYFDNRNLPYFWAKGFNLLSILKPTELTEYTQTLNSVWNTLKTYPQQYRLTYERVCDHFQLPSDLEPDSN